MIPLVGGKFWVHKPQTTWEHREENPILWELNQLSKQEQLSKHEVRVCEEVPINI